jgi:uncharacterized protein (TIGR02466 family)
MNFDLNFSSYNIFCTPVYKSEKKDYLNFLNQITDEIINNTVSVYKKNNQDIPNSYHSENLKEHSALFKFKTEILYHSEEILKSQGYDLKNRKMIISELWVQQFPKEGGHHEAHIHSNNHISGFYFLKCSEKTSYPIFHDPRVGKTMTDLPRLETDEINNSSKEIKFNISPGTFIFFNSYLPHSYIKYKGKDEFRFLHFNVQSILNDV